MNHEIFLHTIKKIFSEKLLPRLREEADRGRWEGVNSSMFQLSIDEDGAWIELSYTADGFYNQIFHVGTCDRSFDAPGFKDKVSFMPEFAYYDFKNLAEKKGIRDALDRTNEDFINKMMLVLEEHNLIFFENVEGTGIKVYLGDCRPKNYRNIDGYITFFDIVLPLLSTPKEKYEQLLEDSDPLKILAGMLSLELK